MAEKDENKVTCPECGHEVGTKEDGTKIKVHKIAGERCDGSEAEVSTLDADGIAKGDPFEALEASQDDEQATDDSTDPADESGAQTDAQKLASSGDGGEFVHKVRVRKPAPHVEGDDAWHDANVKMAAKAAARGDYVLVREPKFAGTEETETHVIVRYSAPVK